MSPNDSSMLVSNASGKKGAGTAKVIKQTDKYLNFDAFNKQYDKNEGKNNENHRRTM